MDPFTTLAQSLGIAYAAGISPYATIALLGLANRMNWIGPLPGILHGSSEPDKILKGTQARLCGVCLWKRRRRQKRR